MSNLSRKIEKPNRTLRYLLPAIDPEFPRRSSRPLVRVSVIVQDRRLAPGDTYGLRGLARRKKAHPLLGRADKDSGAESTSAIGRMKESGTEGAGGPAVPSDPTARSVPRPTTAGGPAPAPSGSGRHLATEPTRCRGPKTSRRSFTMTRPASSSPSARSIEPAGDRGITRANLLIEQSTPGGSRQPGRGRTPGSPGFVALAGDGRRVVPE